MNRKLLGRIFLFSFTVLAVMFHYVAVRTNYEINREYDWMVRNNGMRFYEDMWFVLRSFEGLWFAAIGGCLFAILIWFNLWFNSDH